MADPTYYYPERTYHDLNSVAYPDHSIQLTGMGGEVLRAFWRKGEQMWDEDMNNTFEWLAFWAAPYVYWRSEPHYVWYSPYTKLYVTEPDHCTIEPFISATPLALVYDSISTPNEFDRVYKMYPGSRALAIADGVYFGRTTGGGGVTTIKGLAHIQEYVNEIEIAFFFSETRSGEIAGGHTVVEPFWLRGGTYSSRLRGWPRTSASVAPLSVLKNGVVVGHVHKYQYGSGLVMLENTQFDAGDRLEIKAPDVYGARRSVYLSLVGELL